MVLSDDLAGWDWVWEEGPRGRRYMYISKFYKCLPEPLRSSSTSPACFADVPLSLQVAPLGQDLRQ